MNRFFRLVIFTAAAAIGTTAQAAPAVAADDAAHSGSTAAVFAIAQERSENGHREVIRYNTKTGESWYNWTTVAPEWIKIGEAGPIPAGDYQVLLTPGTSKDTIWGLRFDRVSGRTWNFGGTGWSEFKEAK